MNQEITKLIQFNGIDRGCYCKLIRRDKIMTCIILTPKDEQIPERIINNLAQTLRVGFLD